MSSPSCRERPFDVLSRIVEKNIGHGEVIGDAVGEVLSYDKFLKTTHGGKHILPGDVHGAWANVDAEIGHRIKQLTGALAMHHRAQDQAEADRLAMKEFLLG